MPIAAKESAVVLSPPAASASGEALARLAEYARGIGATHQLALQAPALVHSVRTASEGPASQAARAALVAHASRFVHFGDAVDARALEQAVRLCDAMEGQGSLQAALATSTAARVEVRVALEVQRKAAVTLRHLSHAELDGTGAASARARASCCGIYI